MPGPKHVRALGAALTLAAALTAPAAHSADTLRVEERVELTAAPARVWATIGAFEGLAGWHPVVATTAIVSGRDNRIGAIREITTKDGARITEELLAYDGPARTMRYRILESPLPVTDYVSTLSVEAAGSGSRVVWKSEFRRAVGEAAAGVDDAGAREVVTGIYLAGFEGLRAVLGEGGKAGR